MLDSASINSWKIIVKVQERIFLDSFTLIYIYVAPMDHMYMIQVKCPECLFIQYVGSYNPCAHVARCG